MKLLNILLSALVLTCAKADKAPYSSSHYGCPDECHTQEDPKCEIDLPESFVALHPRYFEDKSFRYCGHYYVGMIIDNEKADGKYKLVRAKVVDQCGSCAETQVDLNMPTFEKLANEDHGIIKMIYTILGTNNKVLDGPVYSKSYLEAFAKKQNRSKEEIKAAFMEMAKKMNTEKRADMKYYPWQYEGYRNPLEPKIIGGIEINTNEKNSTTNLNNNSTLLTNTTNTNTTTSTVKTEQTQITIVEDAQNETYETEKETDEPVTASIIGGTACIGCAATIGLVMLKRKNPQKYDDLKQKFPEAFSAVKRSVSRSVSRSATFVKRSLTTTKRGMGRVRSVNGNGNGKVGDISMSSEDSSDNIPFSVPSSTYTFTVNNVDGLPRVALYDEPYLYNKDNKNNEGQQPW